ncbi:KilA-N domain-containing protein [Gluconobacter cerinus]|uniref:KilA-N domain-containing protein n=1 Tax=Gluconobacter cerinus TaxID=38307 RepID=UPI001B8C9E08|nr:KilA-N domain-containing protein [Gluconobacter cerinus]
MTQLTILGTNIRQDAEGRYCLNDCHRASGAEKKDGPSYWLATKDAEKLIAKLDEETTGKSVVSVEGRNGGTFVAKELVYAYAMWIDPAFHLKVIRAFDAMVSGKGPLTVQTLSREQQLASAVLLSQDIIREKDEKIAILAPKAESFDALANLEGRHNLRSAAAQCGWPQNKFIDQLITLGWVYVNPVTGRKHAYSDRLKTGMMEVKNVEVKRTGYTEGVGQPMITQKGLTRLKMLLGVYQAAPSREMELH